MKHLLLGFALLFSSVLYAMEPLPTDSAHGLIAMVKYVAGDYAVFVFLAVLAVGFVWAQVRAFIKPETLSKLPLWLLVPLEWAAANHHHAQNAIDRNPVQLKKQGG